MSSQPPQGPNPDPDQPPDPAGYGTPMPPTPQYEAPQYGSAQPPAGYGQMPPAPSGPYATGGTVAQPASITKAVLLMRVGAGLSVLGLLLALLTMGDVKDLISQSGTGLTAEQINAAAAVAVAASIVGGLIAAGLWLWMAWANGKGKKWARILSTVFFVLSLLSAIANLAQGKTPPLNLVLVLISVVLGGYVIFLLYKKESTAFYEGMSAAQTPR